MFNRNPVQDDEQGWRTLGDANWGECVHDWADGVSSNMRCVAVKRFSANRQIECPKRQVGSGMLTEILDQWELLVELQRQKDSWQSRWEQATTAYQNSLSMIDPVDADRLHRVLSESLPTLEIQTTVNGSITESAASSHTTPSEPAVTEQSADVVERQNVESAASDAIPSDQLAKVADHVTATDAQNAAVDEPSATEEVSLLHWATETIGDGITENDLFQTLRNSTYASQARELFEILKERDAFYETDDGTIHVQSLKQTEEVQQ